MQKRGTDLHGNGKREGSGRDFLQQNTNDKDQEISRENKLLQKLWEKGTCRWELQTTTTEENLKLMLLRQNSRSVE